jgi:hypothetical protein
MKRIKQIQDAYIATRRGKVVFVAVGCDSKAESELYSIQWPLPNPNATNIMDMVDWNIYEIYKRCEIYGHLSYELHPKYEVINLRGAVRHKDDIDYLKFAQGLIKSHMGYLEKLLLHGAAIKQKQQHVVANSSQNDIQPMTLKGNIQ